MYYVDTNPYPKPYSPGNSRACTIWQFFGERAPADGPRRALVLD